MQPKERRIRRELEMMRTGVIPASKSRRAKLARDIDAFYSAEEAKLRAEQQREDQEYLKTLRAVAETKVMSAWWDSGSKVKED